MQRDKQARTNLFECGFSMNQNPKNRKYPMCRKYPKNRKYVPEES